MGSGLTCTFGLVFLKERRLVLTNLCTSAFNAIQCSRSWPSAPWLKGQDASALYHHGNFSGTGGGDLVCIKFLSISRSEEHTSELQSRGLISYAVCCLKK